MNRKEVNTDEQEMLCFYLIIIYEFCPKQGEKSSDLKSSRIGNDRNGIQF